MKKRNETKHVWKQLLCTMLTLAMILTLIPVSSLSVDAKNNSVAGKATYKDKKSESAEVEVPEQISKEGKTYNVTQIASDAFNDETVTDVALPDTVTELKSGAFANDTKLETIEINSKRMTVGKNIFKKLTKAQKANIKVYVSDNMSDANFKKLQKKLVKQGLKKKNIKHCKKKKDEDSKKDDPSQDDEDDEFEPADPTVSPNPYDDVDLSDQVIVGQDDLDKFEDAITLKDGTTVLDDMSGALAAQTGANGLGIGEIAEFTKEIIEAVGHHEKYENIMDAFEEIEKDLRKLDDIEQEIQNLSHKLDQQRLDEALKSRNKTLTTLSAASLPVLKTIHNYTTNSKGKYNKNWFNDEKTFNKVYKELKDWANKTVDGSTMTVAVPAFLQLYTTPVVDNLNYVQIYDKVALDVYPWEHEGYNFRENARLGDLMIMIETYMLSDLYYECEKKATGDDKSAYVEQLQQSMKTYLAQFDNNPVVHHDNVIICQLKGCEYTFNKNIDFIDMCTSARANFSNHDFNMASDNESTRASNITFMENVLYRSDCYSNADLNKDKKTYSTYEYLPANVYQKIYCYYMEKNKTTSNPNEKVNNFFDILKKAGFTNANQLTSTRKEPVFVTNVDRGYDSYSRHGGFGKNYLNYKNFHLCCNPWRSNHDSVDLAGLLDRNMHEKSGGDAEIIDRCNFTGSSYMNRGGRNTNLLLMSLHVVKKNN